MTSPYTPASAVEAAPLFSLRDVTKSYGRRCVLRVARFDSNAPDTLVITGNNGSGKSTFLRLLAGITETTSGELVRYPFLTRCRTVFVPQTRGLNPEATVAQNLCNTLQLYDVPQQVDLSDLPYVSEFGLQRSLSQTVGKLSTGYQKLVALAAAFCVEPEVIFLDEPLNGLDRAHCDVISNGINTLSRTAVLLAVTAHSVVDWPNFKRYIEFTDGALRELP